MTIQPESETTPKTPPPPAPHTCTCGQTIRTPTAADMARMLDLHRQLVHAGATRNGSGRRP